MTMATIKETMHGKNNGQKNGCRRDESVINKMVGLQSNHYRNVLVSERE